jgi:hypothetical protein
MTVALRSYKSKDEAGTMRPIGWNSEYGRFGGIIWSSGAKNRRGAAPPPAIQSPERHVETIRIRGRKFE